MKSEVTLKVTKDWLESFTIEEGLEDCSAGVLQLSDLIHFAEPDPVDSLPTEPKDAKLTATRRRAPRTSPLAAPTKPL